MYFRNPATSRPRMAWGSLLVLLLMWGLLVHESATAAPAAQDDIRALGLGEYGAALGVAGDTVVYEMEIPEAGVYVISAIDEESAATFGLTATGADGEVLYDDIFTSVELALEPGILTLEFSASASETLFFVVAGEVGSMSPESGQPGRLLVGGAYAEDDVSTPRYAQLVVPPTASPQRVIIYVESEEGDNFSALVEGDDIDSIGLDTDQSNLLSFWSSGGIYGLTVEPHALGSAFSLAVFLSPPPTLLVPGDIVDNLIPAGAEDILFEIELDRPYELLNIDLVDGAEGLAIDFVDRLFDARFDQSSFGEEFLDVENVPPGTYYIRVYGDAQDEDRLITLSVTGEAGEPIESLTLDEATLGFMEEGTEVVYYQVEIPEAGLIVAAAIASETEDAEFSVSAGLRLGEPIWHSYQEGEDDVVVFVAPVAGIYYVGVESNGAVGDYAVAVSLGDLAPLVLGDGTPALGSVDGFETALHRMEISEADQIVTLMLVGSQASDLDVQLSGYNALGDTTVFQYGPNFGPLDVVSAVAPEAGILEIMVTSYTDEPANYALIAYVDDPRRAVGLWAIDAAASSEYGEDDYSALQATGPPDTPIPGDRPTAWASLEPDAGEEILELAYEFPIVPAEINIYETYNPGAIVGVQIYDLALDEWVTVWEGEAEPLDQPSRIFSIDLPPSNVLTDGVRIFLDTEAVPGWNEIDAVELRGRP